ncbi:hypothetical protein [Bradyrhizobium pachyrhizi]|uniref:hypothetical protein n=1 Tax=Bradyrhizobium pachyrhizi TaxID=280333 RepID=UPI000B083B46|nr:hypothetical protein [Bradyrhizobium pachyrhizi]
MNDDNASESAAVIDWQSVLEWARRVDESLSYWDELAEQRWSANNPQLNGQTLHDSPQCLERA